MRRKAIDDSGAVGMQYDASRDKVLEDSQLLHNTGNGCFNRLRTALFPTPSPPVTPAKCEYIHGDKVTCETLAKTLEIDDRQVLSLLLEPAPMTERQADAALFNYTDWNSQRKRIFYYRQIYQKASLPRKPKYTKYNLKPIKPEATHIIASVSSGVAILIVLAMPSDLLMDTIDEKLDDVCAKLRNNQHLDQINELSAAFQGLEINAIYSNVKKLISHSDVKSVWNAIKKLDKKSSPPLFYQLMPITDAYPDSDVYYYENNYSINYDIQSRLLLVHQLLNQVQQLPADQKNSHHHQEYKKLKSHSSNLHEALISLIAQIDRGEEKQYKLGALFQHQHYASLKDDLKKIIESHQSSSQPTGPTPHISTQTKTINILLLGETGVGKSTFINALANYLKFNSLDNAKRDGPIAVIPSSFIITRGTHFDQTTVYIGKPTDNEKHNDRGQSVTQHCQTHPLFADENTKLSVIDVPGIGDTRGVDQDQANIKHIASFVKKLDHLDVVCILLKPNVARLHPSFRLYFTEMLRMLPPNMSGNIVFCFTNTRSTFYAPGQTIVVLQELLGELRGTRIKFGPSNSFCFDSESFRYLVAVKQGVSFGDREEKEYRESWKKSATETSRFLDCIRSLKPVSTSGTAANHDHF